MIFDLKKENEISKSQWFLKCIAFFHKNSNDVLEIRYYSNTLNCSLKHKII